jgi:hypothetical protein
VPLFVDDFQRQVGGCAAEGLVDCIQVVRFLGKAKISDECVPLAIKDNVLGLKVTVNDAVLV